MTRASSNEIAVLDSCDRAIATAEKLSELTDLISQAEAVRVWAKSANQSLEVQNRAAELRLLAERKAGKMLSQMRLHGGDRRSNNHDDCLILADLGITQNQSTRWQKEASVGDQEFADYVRSTTLLGKEITAAGLIRLAAGRIGKKKQPVRTYPLRQLAPPLRFSEPAEMAVRENESADLLEAINHVNLLQQVLRPYANSEAEALSKSERRAVLYLLSEVSELLEKASRHSRPASQSSNRRKLGTDDHAEEFKLNHAAAKAAKNTDNSPGSL